MRNNSSRGLILLVVLWVMVVLTILGTSYFHLASLSYQTSRNILDKYQAQLLAEGVLQLALSELAQSGAVGHHDLSGDWSGAGKLFEAASLGEGLMQIYTADLDSEEGGTRFGLRDESSKLNINVATRAMLEKLPNMNRARAASILDWRDPDSEVTGGGAEQDYYAERTPPYDPRNGPFQTLGELLQVKGINPRLLYGEDVNMDGVLQTAEDDGGDNDPPDNGDGILDQGLATYLTLYSYDLNQNAAGEKRLNLNSASEETLRQRLEGKISEDSLKKVLAHKKDNPIENLAQLLTGKPTKKKEGEDAKDPETPKKKPQSRPLGAGAESSANEDRSERRERRRERKADEGPSADSRRAERASRQLGTTSKPIGGEKETGDEDQVDTATALVTQDEFKTIVDELTLLDDERLPGLVNINTAPREVLMCLPGMTEHLADAILGRRGADEQAFSSVGELVSLEGMNLDTLADILPHVTVRSYVFEARAVGYVPESKAYAAIYAILDRGGGDNKFLNYRVLR